MRQRVSLVDALGLRPFSTTLAQTRITFGGDPLTPRTRFDLSSLRQLKPHLAVPLWLGLSPRGRRVPITNLYNHRQPPPELGWSVRVTDVLDFRSGKNTYDSHNGTDFAIPPGTTVVAAAPGIVIRVSSEFHRGGRKVFLDHGRGVCTSYNHLTRSLVQPGQRVGRGEPIAISGYSGIDAVVGFPWTPPHVHFNVWLNGLYVDPFARGHEVSMWRAHNDPRPARAGDLSDRELEPTPWDELAIEAIADACLHGETRAEIEGAGTVHERAGAALMALNYFPTRFSRGTTAELLYRERFPREPRLDLPFSSLDYDGVVF